MWDLGAVGIVAVHANLAFDGVRAAVPVAAGPAMGAGLPVAIRRPVATAAQERTLGKLDLPPVASLQQLQVLLVMAVEAVVVPVVRAMFHHNILMLLRDNDVVLRVEF